jgi:hypothetical protein
MMSPTRLRINHVGGEFGASPRFGGKTKFITSNIISSSKTQPHHHRPILANASLVSSQLTYNTNS